MAATAGTTMKGPKVADMVAMLARLRTKTSIAWRVRGCASRATPKLTRAVTVASA